MKVSRYAVSVQWGGGFHYFVKYFDAKEEALNFAKAWRTKKKKGARPKAHIWYLMDSFEKE